MPDKKQEVADQVNVQAVLQRHNIGRFELILIATQVARLEKCRPHDALKKMLEIEDLDVYFKEMKERQLKAEFNSRF